jgi:phosphoribosylanthranilate isomerase
MRRCARRRERTCSASSISLAEIIESLGSPTQKVLACDPESAEEAYEFSRISGADMLQLYSLQPQVLQELRDLGGSAIRAVKPDRAEVARFVNCADALLFEMGEPGTGASYDYSKAPTECCPKSIIGGGLRADNLDAAKAKNPYALDVSSGVESVPGRKDPRLVSEFIRRCKE